MKKCLQLCKCNARWLGILLGSKERCISLITKAPSTPEGVMCILSGQGCDNDDDAHADIYAITVDDDDDAAIAANNNDNHDDLANNLGKQP